MRDLDKYSASEMYGLLASHLHSNNRVNIIVSYIDLIKFNVINMLNMKY